MLSVDGTRDSFIVITYSSYFIMFTVVKLKYATYFII